MITFRRFAVITPKRPCCYAVHARHWSAAYGDLGSITWAHSPPLAAAEVNNSLETEISIGSPAGLGSVLVQL